MSETYPCWRPGRKGQQSKKKMQSWSVPASHPQNLTVDTMTAPFYRIVWWLAIALFVSFFLFLTIGRSLA
jgi:hypothetical protein